ncbi:MAG: MFS transporter [Hyphomonadaceae bacterium]
MSSPEPSIFATRAARVTLVMSCLFGTTGVILVYLPRWLEVERLLTGAEIGAVLSLAQAARLVTGPAIAYWADGVADRRTPMRIVSVAALIAYAAFFFLARDFASLLVLGFVALSLTQAMTPLVEAATLRATAHGRMSYGVARGIGSIAFIVANIAGGFLVARFGLGAVVVWVITGLAVVIASAWRALPPDPPPARKARAERAGELSALLRNRRFLIVIVACGLIQSAHAFYYGFSTMAWRAQDLPDGMIGMLWGFGVAVEVVFLWSLPAIERRFPPETLILLGAGGGVLRWLAMGWGPTDWPLWPLQALHALSFAAAHVGAMRLIHRETPETSAAMGQTLYAVLTGGILMGGCTLLSGMLYDSVGLRGYWAMAAIALAGGLLAIPLLDTPKRRGAATSR